MVTVHGYKACDCIAASITGVEASLKAVGAIRNDLTGLITQGSYSTAVSASAGTHSGGGVWDLSPTLGTTSALKAMRERGWVAWYRKPDQGPWPAHVHVVLDGCPHLAASAKNQITEYRNGGDGLVGTKADDGPRVSPMLTWQQALLPAVSVGHLKAAAVHDMPAPTGTVSQYAGEVKLVEAALNGQGLLSAAYVDGSWGTRTRDAYAAWQRKIGLTGTAADGVPGLQSLTALARVSGPTFRAVA